MTQKISRTDVENEHGYQRWHMYDESVNGVSWSTYVGHCWARLEVTKRRDGTLQFEATEAGKSARTVYVTLQREAVKSLLEYLSEWQEVGEAKTNSDAGMTDDCPSDPGGAAAYRRKHGIQPPYAVAEAIPYPQDERRGK